MPTTTGRHREDQAAFSVESESGLPGKPARERCYETPVGGTERKVPCSIMTNGHVPAERNPHVKALLEKDRAEIRRACDGNRNGEVKYRGHPVECAAGWPPDSN